jgi:hypothetical protein
MGGCYSMWNYPQPASSMRQLARLCLGAWFAFKGKERAAALRGSASRMKPGLEKDSKLVTARWLRWASEHPVEAVGQVEKSYDEVVHPRPSRHDDSWV